MIRGILLVGHGDKGNGSFTTITFAASYIDCPNPAEVCWQRSAAAHKRLRACATVLNHNDCCYMHLQHLCSQVVVNVVSCLFFSFPQISSMIAPQSCKICSAVWKEMCSLPPPYFFLFPCPSSFPSFYP